MPYYNDPYHNLSLRQAISDAYSSVPEYNPEAHKSQLGLGFESARHGFKANEYYEKALTAREAGDANAEKHYRTLARAEEIEAARYNPAVQNATDIRGVGDFVNWGLSSTGQMAASMGPTLLGSIGGRLAGAATGAALGSVVPGIGNVAGAIGGFLGGAIPGYLMERNETIGEAMREDPENKLDPSDIRAASRVKGGLAGAAEAFVPGAVGKGLISPVEKIAGKGIRNALGRGSFFETALAEGATEGTQSLIGQAAQNYLFDRPLTEFDYWQALNEAAAGAVGGGVLGGAAKGVHYAKTKLGEQVDGLKEKATKTKENIEDVAGATIDAARDTFGQQQQATATPEQPEATVAPQPEATVAPEQPAPQAAPQAEASVAPEPQVAAQEDIDPLDAAEKLWKEEEDYVRSFDPKGQYSSFYYKNGKTFDSRTGEEIIDLDQNTHGENVDPDHPKQIQNTKELAEWRAQMQEWMQGTQTQQQAQQQAQAQQGKVLSPRSRASKTFFEELLKKSDRSFDAIRTAAIKKSGVSGREFSFKSNDATKSKDVTRVSQNLQKYFPTIQAKLDNIKIYPSLEAAAFDLQDKSRIEKFIARIEATDDPLGIQGFTTPDGKVAIIANAIKPGEEISTFLHEVGVHVGFRGIFGRQGMQRISTRISDIAKNGSEIEQQIAAKAIEHARSQVGIQSKNYNEEVAAYFIQYVVENGYSPQVAQPKTLLAELIDWILNNIQQFLGNKYKLNLKNITPEQLVDTAYNIALDTVNKNISKTSGTNTQTQIQEGTEGQDRNVSSARKVLKKQRITQEISDLKNYTPEEETLNEYDAVTAKDERAKKPAEEVLKNKELFSDEEIVAAEDFLEDGDSDKLAAAFDAIQQSDGDLLKDLGDSLNLNSDETRLSATHIEESAVQDFLDTWEALESQRTVDFAKKIGKGEYYQESEVVSTTERNALEYLFLGIEQKKLNNPRKIAIALESVFRDNTVDTLERIIRYMSNPELHNKSKYEIQNYQLQPSPEYSQGDIQSVKNILAAHLQVKNKRAENWVKKIIFPLLRKKEANRFLKLSNEKKVEALKNYLKIASRFYNQQTGKEALDKKIKNTRLYKPRFEKMTLQDRINYVDKADKLLSLFIEDRNTYGKFTDEELANIKKKKPIFRRIETVEQRNRRLEAFAKNPQSFLNFLMTFIRPHFLGLDENYQQTKNVFTGKFTEKGYPIFKKIVDEDARINKLQKKYPKEFLNIQAREKQLYEIIELLRPQRENKTMTEHAFEKYFNVKPNVGSSQVVSAISVLQRHFAKQEERNPKRQEVSGEFERIESKGHIIAGTMYGELQATLGKVRQAFKNIQEGKSNRTLIEQEEERNKADEEFHEDEIQEDLDRVYDVDEEDWTTAWGEIFSVEQNTQAPMQIETIRPKYNVIATTTAMTKYITQHDVFGNGVNKLSGDDFEALDAVIDKDIVDPNDFLPDTSEELAQLIKVRKSQGHMVQEVNLFEASILQAADELHMNPVEVAALLEKSAETELTSKENKYFSPLNYALELYTPQWAIKFLNEGGIGPNIDIVEDLLYRGFTDNGEGGYIVNNQKAAIQLAAEMMKDKSAIALVIDDQYVADKNINFHMKDIAQTLSQENIDRYLTDPNLLNTKNGLSWLKIAIENDADRSIIIELPGKDGKMRKVGFSIPTILRMTRIRDKNSYDKPVLSLLLSGFANLLEIARNSSARMGFLITEKQLRRAGSKAVPEPFILYINKGKDGTEPLNVFEHRLVWQEKPYTRKVFNEKTGKYEDKVVGVRPVGNRPIGVEWSGGIIYFDKAKKITDPVELQILDQVTSILFPTNDDLIQAGFNNQASRLQNEQILKVLPAFLPKHLHLYRETDDFLPYTALQAEIEAYYKQLAKDGDDWKSDSTDPTTKVANLKEIADGIDEILQQTNGNEIGLDIEISLPEDEKFTEALLRSFFADPKNANYAKDRNNPAIQKEANKIVGEQKNVIRQTISRIFKATRKLIDRETKKTRPYTSKEKANDIHNLYFDYFGDKSGNIGASPYPLEFVGRSQRSNPRDLFEFALSNALREIIARNKNYEANDSVSSFAEKLLKHFAKTPEFELYAAESNKGRDSFRMRFKLPREVIEDIQVAIDNIAWQDDDYKNLTDEEAFNELVWYLSANKEDEYPNGEVMYTIIKNHRNYFLTATDEEIQENYPEFWERYQKIEKFAFDEAHKAPNEEIVKKQLEDFQKSKSTRKKEFFSNFASVELAKKYLKEKYPEFSREKLTRNYTLLDWNDYNTKKELARERISQAAREDVSYKYDPEKQSELFNQKLAREIEKRMDDWEVSYFKDTTGAFKNEIKNLGLIILSGLRSFDEGSLHTTNAPSFEDTIYGSKEDTFTNKYGVEETATHVTDGEFSSPANIYDPIGALYTSEFPDQKIWGINPDRTNERNIREKSVFETVQRDNMEFENRAYPAKESTGGRKLKNESYRYVKQLKEKVKENPDAFNNQSPTSIVDISAPWVNAAPWAKEVVKEEKEKVTDKVDIRDVLKAKRENPFGLDEEAPLEQPEEERKFIFKTNKIPKEFFIGKMVNGELVEKGLLGYLYNTTREAYDALRALNRNSKIRMKEENRNDTPEIIWTISDEQLEKIIKNLDRKTDDDKEFFFDQLNNAYRNGLNEEPTPLHNEGLDWTDVVVDEHDRAMAFNNNGENLPIINVGNVNFKNKHEHESVLSGIMYLPSGLTYKGEEFVTIEHAYQTWKSGKFDKVAYNIKNKNSNTPAKPLGVLKTDTENRANIKLKIDIVRTAFLQNASLLKEIVKNDYFKNYEIRNDRAADKTDNDFWDKNYPNVLRTALYQVEDHMTRNQNHLQELASRVNDRTVTPLMTVDDAIKTIEEFLKKPYAEENGKIVLRIYPIEKKDKTETKEGAVYMHFFNMIESIYRKASSQERNEKGEMVTRNPTAQRAANKIAEKKRKSEGYWETLISPQTIENMIANYRLGKKLDDPLLGYDADNALIDLARDILISGGEFIEQTKSGIEANVKKENEAGTTYFKDVDLGKNYQNYKDVNGDDMPLSHLFLNSKDPEKSAKEAEEYLQKVLGTEVEYKIFKENEWGDKKTYGKFTETDGKKLISLALAGNVLSTAHHESFHAFLSVLKKHAPQHYDKLLKYSEKYKDEVIRILKQHEAFDAVKSAEGNAEEMAAYAYQLAMGGYIPTNALSKRVVGKLGQMWFRVAGLFNDVMRRKAKENVDVLEAETKLAMIYRRFNSGELVHSKEAFWQNLEQDMEVKRKFERFNNAVKMIGKWGDALVNSADAVLRRADIPALTQLADLFYSDVVDRDMSANLKEGQTGDALLKTTRLRNEWENTYNHIIHDLSENDKELIRKALIHKNSKEGFESLEDKPVLQEKYNEIRKLYDKVFDDMVELGTYKKIYKRVKTSEGWKSIQTWEKLTEKDREEGFLPMLWNKNAIAQNRIEFTNLLIEEINNQRKENAEKEKRYKKGEAVHFNRFYIPELDENLNKIKDPVRTYAEDLVATILGERIIEENLQDRFFWVQSNPFGQEVMKQQYLGFINDRLKFDKFFEKSMDSVFYEYAMRSAKTAIFHNIFGIGDNSKIEVLLKEARDFIAKREKLDPKNEEDAAKLQQLMKPYERAVMSMCGKLGADISPQLRKINAMGVTYQNFRLLALAIFASFQDVVGLSIHGGTLKDQWQGFVRGLREIKNTWYNQESKDEWVKRAEDFGIVDPLSAIGSVAELEGTQHLTGRSQKLSKAFFRWNGLEGWNRGLKAQAFIIAERRIKQWATQGINVKNKADGLLFKRCFGDMKPSDIKLEKDGSISLNRQNADAVHRIIADMIMTPTAANRPVWANDPHYMLFAQLKTFSYTLHRVMLRGLAEQFRLGNVGPAGIAMAGMVPVALTGYVIKEMLLSAFDDDDDTDWKFEPRNLIPYAIIRAGIGGIPHMYLEDAWEMDFARMLGPTTDQIQNILSIPLRGWNPDYLPGKVSYQHTAKNELVSALPGSPILKHLPGMWEK